METTPSKKKSEFIPKKSQNITKSMIFTWKKEKGEIVFDQDGIKIPENLSRLIKGDVADLITDDLITRNDGFYLFKVDEAIKLKILIRIKPKISKQKYTIIFGVGMGFFSRPILKFKNLDHVQYKHLLQILEANNIFSKEDLAEFDEFANDWIYTKNTWRNFIWGIVSTFFLGASLALIDYLTGNYRIIVLLYYILIGIYLLFNLITPLPFAFRWKDSTPNQQRRIHITQVIARNLFIVITLFVYIFALTR